MTYDFETCFWDKDDKGVNVLLSHISAGIKSCDTMITFFKQKCEIEKDYARRVGAINEKLNKDLKINVEFGQLAESFNLLYETEVSKAQSHSKQSELIYRQIFNDLKDFTSELQARYTTLSGKIEGLRLDKFNKMKGCEDLTQRLEKAEIRVRDLQLNQNNIIGSKRVEQNKRDLIKWESNTQEIKNQLSLLKQEYKASKKYWLHEWAGLTIEFQRMETARISFLQSKLQQYLQTATETSLLEQTKMEILNNKLMNFASNDDISKFSSEYGTGRLKKEKRSKNRETSSHTNHTVKDTTQLRNSTQPKRNSLNISNISNSKRESYIDNIRTLSSQIQESVNSKPKITQNLNNLMYQSLQEKPLPIPVEKTTINGQKSITDNDDNNNRPATQITETIKLRQDQLSKDTPRAYKEIVIDLEEESEKEKEKEKEKEEEIIKNNKMSILPYNKASRHTNSLTSTEIESNSVSPSASTSSGSNPTDFTTHVKNKQSIDSMTTSVSTMASTIDDSQRFAKSWNSMNRKRKSISYLQSLSNSTSPTSSSSSPPIDRRSTFLEQQQQQEEVKTNEQELRNVSSTNSIRINPNIRQSQNIEKVPDPYRQSLISGHSESIQRKDPQTDTLGKGQINDNGIIITLPLTTRNGEHVIKYAKALYPLMTDQTSTEVINFDTNDYILINEVINENWFRGEVYDNDRIPEDRRSGLIPFNFIRLLS
ncbi:formin-binding protein HOF1 NDAI_0B01380 [Naumovozyma dairenensis CBS 421]|uniref:SH3 domain-containing protein n=1 Tax=Naumovozyma dairenensis (strain ATCC 10597 / BCRC 20456 / CBS 421 / NBRC 0211 / NRRL Y-12639) TaxID=1071378 RepID=G0W5W1_NAUDC|nr:hypothetical protein NDAI_0B01380 [Naumovozyma dairenensis CBS 421]CCD23172.1 hypothetical protein NDAI_0B01380 [Naumovozyma dairenensis CBS 421]